MAGFGECLRRFVVSRARRRYGYLRCFWSTAVEPQRPHRQRTRRNAQLHHGAPWL